MVSFVLLKFEYINLFVLSNVWGGGVWVQNSLTICYVVNIWLPAAWRDPSIIIYYILATGLTTTLLESKLYYHQHRSESAYAWARNEAIIINSS